VEIGIALSALVLGIMVLASCVRRYGLRR